MALVGTIVAITGVAYLITDNGARRELKLGDQIQTGDTIQTPRGVEAELQLTNGRLIHIYSEQLVKFTEELSEAIAPSNVDSALNLATIETVIKAIEEGKDINAVLEETAAGQSGLYNSYGFNFVDLFRINDILNAFNFEYDYEISPRVDTDPLVDANDITYLESLGVTAPTSGPKPAINSAPVIAAQSFTYTENQVAGAPVASVVASDNVAVTDYRFTATNTNLSADGYFQISSAGVISITAAGVAANVNDFEAAPNSASYSISAYDADGNSSAASITLEELNENEAPVANADTGVVNEDATRTVIAVNGVIQGSTGGSAADSDIDNTTASLVVSGAVAGTGAVVQGAGVGTTLTGTYGTLTLNNDGSYSYVANNANAVAQGVTVTDTFSYTVRDPGNLVSNQATLTLSISGTNDGPVAIGDTNTTNEDVASVTVILEGTDIDGTVATFSLTSLPANGILYTDAALTNAVTTGTNYAATGNALTLYFKPTVNANGSTSFNFNATDNNGAVSTIATETIVLTAVNDAPVDGDETNTVTEDTTLTVTDGAVGDLLNNATDVDGDPLTITGYTISGVAGTQAVGTPVLIAGVGSITVNANGSYSFVPVLNYTGAIPVITYTVSDGSLTDSSTLSLIITPVNDAPVNTLPSYTTNEDTVLKLSGLSVTDVDAGTGSITITLSVPSGNGTIAATSGGGVTVSNSGTSSITLTGTLVDINAYLANTANQPTYTPASNASGTVQLTMLTSDMGNTGTGGTLTDTDTVNITINPISDPISDPNSVSVVVGAAINNNLNLGGSDGALLDGKSSYTFGNGIVVSSGNGSPFTYSGGNDLGVKSGNGDNSIEGTESIKFAFPSGMQYVSMGIKNSASDTVKLTAGLEVPDLISSGTITGQITSPVGVPSLLNMQVSLVLQYTDGTSATTNATVSLGGSWSLTYNTGGKTIATANVIALVDGQLFNNGGTGGTTFNISTDMKSFTIAQDTTRAYSLTDNNDGFQISNVRPDASITGTSFSYPIDLYAINPDPSETITSLKLSDLPADTVSLTVVLANGTYVELNPVGGIYDLSAYTSLLSSSTGATGTDKIFLTTSTALSAGYSPTMSLESVDGSTTSMTVIGGSASSTHTGGSGNDYINGGAGSDTLSGGAGDDILVGGTGADTITGGAGDDSLTGGSIGVNDSTTDVFAWNLADAGTLTTPAVDTINTFGTGTAASGGDVLDLRDLLTGEVNTGASLDNYLHFEKSGSDTILYISSNGSFGDGNNVGAPNATVLANDVQQIRFAGVDLIGVSISDQQVIQNLITQQKLITD